MPKRSSSQDNFGSAEHLHHVFLGLKSRFQELEPEVTESHFLQVRQVNFGDSIHEVQMVLNGTFIHSQNPVRQLKLQRRDHPEMHAG